MPLRIGTPRPPLQGADAWYNAEGWDEAALTGRPVLVHFWSVSCHICHETMPELVRYRQAYEPLGLQFVAVHMPRIASDADPAKVEADVARYGLTQPVALDHHHRIAGAYENEFVPAFFLFDGEGRLRFRTAGDKGFERLEPKIREVLGLPRDT
ncbi:MAG: TlpA family protein disulfide reductase [Clostridia bacterium]|nr:TlpA family protein disulfide reductase [Clostridia bacterium]